MIIAITSTGKDLTSKADMRFGRAKYILIYNTDQSQFTAIDNVINLNSVQGAGIQTAQKVAESGANAVITGNLGPKAFRVLDSASIKGYSISKESTIEEAIKAFNNDELKILSQPNVEGHWS